MDANAVGMLLLGNSSTLPPPSSAPSACTPHVLQAVLLLALAIADKEFAARQPVAVVLQPGLPSALSALPAAVEQGQGQGRPASSGPTPAGPAGPEPPSCQLLDQETLALRLHQAGRWPLVLLSCCQEGVRAAAAMKRGKSKRKRPRLVPLSGARPPPPPPSGSYLLAGTLAALPLLVEEAARDASWNPAASFLVVLLDDFGDEEMGFHRVRTAIEVLYRRAASRLVVIESLRVYTWSAYTGLTPCADPTVPTRVADLGPPWWLQLDDVLGDRRLYPELDSPRRLAGCPLRYSGVAWPPFVLNPVKAEDQKHGFDRGVDVQMLRSFARLAGMRLRYVALPDAARAERWGTDAGNGSWTGLLGMLQRGEADVVFGGFSCLPDRARAFHPTVPYISEAISWWVPRPQPVPNWMLLYNALPRRASRGGLFVLVLSVPVLSAFEYVGRLAMARGRRRHPDDGVVKSALSLLASALEQPPLVELRSSQMRLFYFLYIFFFFHFNLVFRASITGQLANRVYEEGLKTYHDLLVHGVEVGTASTDSTSEELLRDADLAPLRGLHKQCEISDCLRRLQQRHPKYGLLFSSAVMEFLMPLYFLDSDGLPYVERLQSPGLPTYVSMYLRAGDPLARIMDSAFLRMVQAGLPDVWLHRVSTDKTRGAASGEDHDSDGTSDGEAGAAGELTLEHLQGALLLLFLGAALAVVAFLAEVGVATGVLVARRLRVSVTWRPATAPPDIKQAAKQVVVQAALENSSTKARLRRHPAAPTGHYY